MIAHPGESFFYIMAKQSEYPKKIISFDLQLNQLIERGLIIDNPDVAKDFLKNVSYFRLQGYWWEFQNDKPITDLSQIQLSKMLLSFILLTESCV